MTKFTMWKKVTKSDLTIISKPQAHPHIMKNKYAKFQKEELHSQEVPIVYILRVKNDYVHNVEKVTKNVLTIIPKLHAYPHTMKKTHAKFQNNQYKL